MLLFQNTQLFHSKKTHIATKSFHSKHNKQAMTSTNEIKKERTFTIQATAKIIIIKNEDNTNKSNLTSSQLKKKQNQKASRIYQRN